MKLIYCVLGIIALYGCAIPTPEVVTVNNPVTGGSSSVVRNNFIPHTGGPPGGPAGSVHDIQIAPAKLAVSGAEYALMIVYGGTDWMFISGELVLNLDGKVVRRSINPAFTRRDVQSGAVVEETAACLVTRSDLEAIANASRVLAQVSGRNGVMFLTFTPGNIAAFKQFLVKS
jgi:hypothetical protein